ncbi:hypothetical protein TNCV_371651 [Trichonephila clavipes]|nr:hypothetical protein TNCV_371651 [Trichonephila clavipes]
MPTRVSSSSLENQITSPPTTAFVGHQSARLTKQSMNPFPTHLKQGETEIAYGNPLLLLYCSISDMGIVDRDRLVDYQDIFGYTSIHLFYLLIQGYELILFKDNKKNLSLSIEGGGHKRCCPSIPPPDRVVLTMQAKMFRSTLFKIYAKSHRIHQCRLNLSDTSIKVYKPCNQQKTQNVACCL